MLEHAGASHEDYHILDRVDAEQGHGILKLCHLVLAGVHGRIGNLEDLCRQSRIDADQLLKALEAVFLVLDHFQHLGGNGGVDRY